MRKSKRGRRGERGEGDEEVIPLMRKGFDNSSPTVVAMSSEKVYSLTRVMNDVFPVPEKPTKINRTSVESEEEDRGRGRENKGRERDGRAPLSENPVANREEGEGTGDKTAEEAAMERERERVRELGLISLSLKSLLESFLRRRNPHCFSEPVRKRRKERMKERGPMLSALSKSG